MKLSEKTVTTNYDHRGLTARHKPYRNIHKALRRYLLDRVALIGRLDPDDTSDLQTWRATMEELLKVMNDHLVHENTFFHRALHHKGSANVTHFDGDHSQHLQKMALLKRQIIAVMHAEGGKTALAYQAYLELTRFVAENLEHMADEETLLTESLWMLFSDEEILAIEHRLVSSLTPEENQFYLRLMLPALNHPERVELLQSMRQGAPEAVFSAALESAQALLNERDWARLVAALNIHH